jgi:hypothetical protein
VLEISWYRSRSQMLIPADAYIRRLLGKTFVGAGHRPPAFFAKSDEGNYEEARCSRSSALTFR